MTKKISLKDFEKKNTVTPTLSSYMGLVITILIMATIFLGLVAALKFLVGYIL